MTSSQDKQPDMNGIARNGASQFPKEKILFLFVLPFLLYICLLPFMPLIEQDESRYSAIPSEMNRTGDYVTPRLTHVVYLEKPPLAYWATAFFFRLFGENAFASRLFSALCAWGCILLAWRMGTFLDGEKAGLYSAGVLATCLFQGAIGRTNILDMPCAFFIASATWAGYRFFARKDASRLWRYLLYLGCGLAFLTKGLIGIVFPMAILFLWLSVQRRWRDIPSLFSPVGLALFLAVVLPWILLVQKANPDFLWFFFVREHLLRYTTTVHGRYHTFLTYVPVLLLGTLPWSAFLVPALRRNPEGLRTFLRVDGNRFLLVWTAFVFLFFSVSSSKLVPYVAPLFPAVAVLLGRLFSRVETSGLQGADPRWAADRLPVVVQASLFIALLVMPPFIEGVRFGKALTIMPLPGWWAVVLVPALAQALLVFLPGPVEKRFPGKGFLATCLLSALFLGSMIFPASRLLTPYKSAWPIAQAIRDRVPPGQEVSQFRIDLYGIEFYTGIRTPLVDARGELLFGIQKLSPEERIRYFPSSKEFFQARPGQGPRYCITRDAGNLADLKKRIPEVQILWENGVFYLLKV
jgi:4-amino-4-deoxy-L-arabinose transferase-like glycosyltransferase